MAPRAPSWRGQLRFSLVSIDVEVYPAHQDTDTHFHQIHKPTGKRINYQKVVKGVGPVDESDIVKGCEYEKGEEILLTDEEVDGAKLETRRTLELVQFVSTDEIDPAYYDNTYYVVPADELANDAFKVLRDALAETGKAGIGQVTMRGHEYIAAIRPAAGGLTLNTLRYANELKPERDFFAGLDRKPAEPEMVTTAAKLIERMSTAFDPAAFKNHYQDALRQLVAEKVKGKSKAAKPQKADEAPAAAAGNIIDIMAALKKSLEVQPAAPAKKPAAKRQGRGKAA